MKHWKATVALILCLIMSFSLSGCKATASVTDEEVLTDTGAMTVEKEENSEGTKETESTLENTHVFMFKSADNPFGTILYEGFQEYMTAKGEKTAFCSPDEATVEAQVTLLQEMILQNVASITISANGSEGYEAVFKKAEEAGIPIVSVDSEVEPEQTVCHVEQALATEVGTDLIQTAVLITLGIDYPGDGKMEEVVTNALETYSGEEISLGVLSSTEDSPVQNEWIDAMKAELGKKIYAGKVSRELDIKYGDDESAGSKVQVGAFLREETVDCIIAPTTVGMVAAAEVLMDNQSEVRLTGLGLPSLMQQYIPLAETEDAFDYVCPYMILWDVPHLGATAAAAVYAACYEGFTGDAGETFEMDEFRDYDVTIYEAYTSGKGTGILAGVPITFYKGNTAEWMSVL